jgi:tripartite-type tricarboxylate transporter receptor subunit TctC
MGGSGKLRILAVSTAERSPLLPDVPGMRELGLPQVDFPVWTGVIGPRDMPRGVVEKLRRAFNAALQDPKLVEHVKGFGHSPVVGGPNDLSKAMLREYDASTKLIQEGIKLE